MFCRHWSIISKNIPDPSIPFESFLNRANTTLPSKSLSIKELKDAFLSENKRKSWRGWHNVIKLCGPLSLAVRNLSMGGLLDFNVSNVTKGWPVFLDDLQFKMFTLMFSQKAAGKTPNFCIFAIGRHFMLGKRWNVNLGVFWETYVCFLKSVVFVNFLKKYCKIYINFNDKAQI